MSLPNVESILNIVRGPLSSKREIQIEGGRKDREREIEKERKRERQEWDNRRKERVYKIEHWRVREAKRK